MTKYPSVKVNCDTGIVVQLYNTGIYKVLSVREHIPVQFYSKQLQLLVHFRHRAIMEWQEGSSDCWSTFTALYVLSDGGLKSNFV